jgi:hypothetical protein
MTTRTYDAAFIKNAGGRSAAVVLLELRERHQAAVHRIKVEHPPGSPKRHSLLVAADAAGRAIFAAEQEAGKK